MKTVTSLKTVTKNIASLVADALTESGGLLRPERSCSSESHHSTEPKFRDSYLVLRSDAWPLAFNFMERPSEKTNSLTKLMQSTFILLDD